MASAATSLVRAELDENMCFMTYSMGLDTRARMARGGAGKELQINVQLLCAGQFYKTA